MAAPPFNNRASLLSGLRTGGVRSVSVPHTAAPTASFHIPAVPHSSHMSELLYEDGVNEVPDSMVHPAHMHGYHGGRRSFVQPRTAGFDVADAMSQQQQDMWTQNRFTPHHSLPVPDVQAQTQAQMQMQIMQLQFMQLQMQQMAQYQSEPQVQHHAKRHSVVQDPLVTGGLNQMMFGDVTQNPYAFYDQKSRKLDIPNNNWDVPMTAALGGKFGGRAVSDHSSQRGLNSVGRFASNVSNANNSVSVQASSTNFPPSKSESAVSWRRSSVIGQSDDVSNRSSSNSPPGVRTLLPIPEKEDIANKVRSEQLRLSPAPSTVPALSNGPSDESEQSDSAQSSSLPSTPSSNHSTEEVSLTHEETTKKPFNGLGLGRPSIALVGSVESAQGLRSVSHPVRQPRGPPAPAEELGEKNFANRIRKKAIGGLGALLEARERRDVQVEVETF